MSEPLFLRMQRVIAASVEGAVDKAEQAAAPSMMRHSIREIEALIDQVRRDQASARKRAEAAKTDQKGLRVRLAALEEQARFALDRDRADLAESAISRQLEIENEIVRLEAVQIESAHRIAEFEGSIGELEARKREMDRQYSTFEAARRAAAEASPPALPTPKRDIQVERAGRAFERAMAATAGAAIEQAEIDALKREALVAERLAALRAGGSAAKTPKRKGR